MRVENLDHLGEVGERTGQPVNFVDHHHIDQALIDVSKQTLQCRSFHRSTRQAAIVVRVFALRAILYDLFR